MLNREMINYISQNRYVKTPRKHHQNSAPFGFQGLNFNMQRAGNATLVILILWKKSNKKLWRGDETCSLIKQGRSKHMNIEGAGSSKNFDHPIPRSFLEQ